MSDAKATTGKMKGFVLVRDKNGRPKFDNPKAHIPDPIWNMLTEEDIKYIKELRDGINSRNSNS